jgi:integrase/recombinase XerD
MKQKVINEVMQEMLGSLNNAQLERLQEVLEHVLFNKEITEKEKETDKWRDK